MKEWYCALDGQAKGPFREADLRDLVRRGMISADTLVWNGDPGNVERGWIKASETEVAELLKPAYDFTREIPISPPPAPRTAQRGDAVRPESVQTGGAAGGIMLAARWRRLLATICDSLILFVVFFLSGFLFLMLIGITSTRLSYIPTMILSVGIALIPPVILLWISLRLLRRNGQTIGKKILRIRIESRKGGMASLSSIIFLRGLPFSVLSIVLQEISNRITTGRMEPSPAALIAILICSAILLIDILLIFRRDRRTLHDMLAGTIVTMG
jgi:uncharacterized RDD family membrane protein YckC